MSVSRQRRTGTRRTLGRRRVPWFREHARSTQMKQILVAYDGGEPARRALQTGIDLVKKFGGSMSVVSVVPVHIGRSPIDPWDDKLVHDQELADARQIVASQGVVAEF